MNKFTFRLFCLTIGLIVLLAVGSRWCGPDPATMIDRFAPSAGFDAAKKMLEDAR